MFLKLMLSGNLDTFGNIDLSNGEVTVNKGMKAMEV